MSKRLKVTLSEDQAEFLERIKHRYGIFKSQYVKNLIMAEMEKEEDRLRPILSIQGVSHPQVAFSNGARLPDSPSLPPILPIGAKLSSVHAVTSVNAEMKKLIAAGKIKRSRAWKPSRKS